VKKMARPRKTNLNPKPGVPTGRTGDQLNEGLSPVEDARHRLRGPFAYEWWYFDAVFDNGYSAVAIVWPMNYGKRWRRQCTIQLSIYAPDGERVKHYVFPPRDIFEASYTGCDVRVGDGYVRGSHPRYEVKLSVEDAGVDLVFEAETPGWKPGTAVNRVPFPRYNTMGWLVPLPRARVYGTLRMHGKTVEVEGHGYHDHNWGEAPIFHLVDNWHWGHVLYGEICVIWADITMVRKLDYARTFMFLLSRGERLVYESADISMSYEDWKEDPQYLHEYPGLIRLSFGSAGEPVSGEIVMRVEDVIETQELLEMSSLPRFLRRAFYKTIARPYYFRWRSSVGGSVEVEGETFPIEGETIHEQMLLRGENPRW
jgi:hypothetical protein